MSIFGRSDFDAAFTPNVSFDDPQAGRVRVQQVRAADLVLPTGQLVACDPGQLIWPDDWGPFETQVPAGKYPVHLAAVEYGYGTTDDYHVACAKLVLTDSRPVRWEPAMRSDQKSIVLRPNELIGYNGGRGGIGCFVDQLTANHFPSDDWEEVYNQQILEPMYDSTPSKVKLWTTLEIDHNTGANLVAFNHRDGGNATYWGFDAGNALCALMIDFLWLTKSIDGSVEFNVRDHIGHTLTHPDFTALQVSPRILPLQKPTGHGFHLELYGNRYWCNVHLMNNDVLHHSGAVTDFLDQDMYATDFVLKEPLAPDAKLVFRYTLGHQALEPIYDADDLLEA